MKSLSIPSVLLTIIFGACASKTTQESVVADSAAVQTSADAVPVSSSAYQPAEEIRNFPDYTYQTVLSDDQLEAEITEGVDEMVSALNNLSLLKYSSYYKKERVYNGDYGEIAESTEETETWFFDRSYKLKAYSKKYYRDGEGRDTRVTTIIYVADTISAVSEYRIDDGQIGLTYHTKLLASKCPKCGISTESEAGGSGKVTETLTRETLMNYRQEFTNIGSLVDMNLIEKAERSDDAYQFTESFENWTDGQTVYQNPFTVYYTIDKDLFTYVQFKNFIELFNGAETSIPKAAVELYLDGPEENTVYRTENLLEDEDVYFLLYTKLKMVGGGIEECHAITISKDGELLSSRMIGRAFEITGPDEPGEDYIYEYDGNNKILTVTEVDVRPGEYNNEERTEKKYDIKLNKDGTLGDAVARQ